MGRTRSTHYARENVAIQPAGKPVIGKFLLALMDPGDEVLYPNPGFPIYSSLVGFFGGVAVPYTYLEDPERFRLDLEGIERRITPRTRLLILNDMHNPTAAESTPAELRRLSDSSSAQPLRALRRGLLRRPLRGKEPLPRLAAGHGRALRHPVHVRQEVRDDGLSTRRGDRTASGHRHHRETQRQLGVVPQPLRPVRRPRGADRRQGWDGGDPGESCASAAMPPSRFSKATPGVYAASSPRRPSTSTRT